MQVSTVGGLAFKPVAYKGVPVMTTAQLARAFGTEPICIRQNHANNTGRFVDGKHFFKVSGSELKALKSRVAYIDLVAQRAAHLTLWTERGAARHAKILETDEAWSVYEQLGQNYFSQRIGLGSSLAEANSPVVFERDGAIFANSRDVARFFEKRHDNVLRNIYALIKAEPSLVVSGVRRGGIRFFEETSYTEASNGETYRLYNMTRDGFSLLAMGFTGAKALQFKLRYIEAFNAMESALKNIVPPTKIQKSSAVRDAISVFKSFCSIGKLIGLDANQTALAADRATFNQVGLNPLKEMGVTHLLAPQQEPHITPTQIAERLGLRSARHANKLLEERGFQVPSVACDVPWQPTPQGAPYAVWLDTGKKTGSGSPIRQLRWTAGIVGVLGVGL